MSISAIAAQLYTIQAKKNVPLKTAFSMLVREDLAMRFSVYNLTKIITKSEFLASVAQTAFGKRTPLQRKQDDELSRKEKSDKKFKQFTVQSIVNLNRTVALLKAITTRNSELINNLYSEIGSYRGQRRIDPKLLSSTAMRVPVMSKTVKGKLDQINKEIEQLKKAPTKVIKKTKGVAAAKKEKEKDQTNFVSAFLPMLLKYPRLLMMLGGGAATAIGLGSFAAQAYSLYNLPGAFGRIAGRFSGRAGFEDPLTEQISQFVDPAVVGIGTYTAGRMVTAAAMYRRGPTAKSWTEAKEGLKARRAIERAERKFAASGGVRTPEEIAKEKKAGITARQIARNTLQARKFGKMSGVLNGISKRLPALAAADVAITIARMSGFVADHTSGKMSQNEFKQNMVGSYSDLISTVGVGGAATIVGGVAGSALFPGVGTAAGAITGGLFGYIASLFFEDNASIQALATRVFEMIHEDKSFRIKKQLADVKEQKPPPQQGTGEIPPDLIAAKKGSTSGLNDAEFINEVYRVSSKYDLNPMDLLEVIYLETAGTFDPAIKNPTSSATGLIQFTEVTAKNLGTSTAALRMMTRAGQMKYVDDYFKMVKLPKGASREQIYAHVFLPSMAQRGVSVFADKNDPNTARYYELNRGLDVVEPYGKLTLEDFRASTNRLSKMIPARTAQMLKESSPLINVTPNVAVKEPPDKAPVTTNDQTVEVTNAQIDSQAALKVASTTHEQVARTQYQLNNHDSRINMLESTTRVGGLSVNDNFEIEWGV